MLSDEAILQLIDDIINCDGHDTLYNMYDQQELPSDRHDIWQAARTARDKLDRLIEALS